jgi:hypothetical protein
MAYTPYRPPSYSVWLADPVGQRLALLDQFLRLEYVRVLNAPGVLKIDLPYNFPISYLRVDNRIDVWRRFAGLRYRDTQAVWFIRSIQKRLAENGQRFISVIAYSAMELLSRRIVAYAAGSSQASKTDQADDMMKAVVRENLGSSATDTDRDLSDYLSVAPDTGAGPSLSMTFPRENVLKVCQDISQAAAEAGTPVYFDVVAAGDDLQFVTYPSYLGVDHSQTGPAPIVLSPAAGTLTDVLREYDHADEVNYVYVGGQGEESNRTVVSGGASERMALSVWNRRESWVDARDTGTAAVLEDDRDAALRAGRPRQVFSGKIVQTGAVYYGVWGFGDRVAGELDGEVVDAVIDEVRVKVEAGEEEVRAGLRVED